MKSPQRLLAVCADDFGAAGHTDAAILRLAGQRRLTDVSCLVNNPRWPAAAAALAAVPAVRQGQVRTGLHLNLSEGRPLSPRLAAVWPVLPELQSLVADAHLGRLPLAAVADELRLQFEAFEHGRGRPPAHVDGHQHVHHLPGVRGLVLALLDRRADIRVRHTGRVGGPGWLVKRLLIEGTGGRALGRILAARQQAANSHLFGVYDFQAADYGALVRRWLRVLPGQGALLFCHPGDAPAASPRTPAGAGAPADAIAPARLREAAYLGSDAFAIDLQAAGVRLA